MSRKAVTVRSLRFDLLPVPGLCDAGFTDVTIEPTHEVAGDAVSALITATA